MTARVIQMRGAELLLYPPESLNPEFWRRWREARGYPIGCHMDADEKLRIYERICGGDDDSPEAA